MYKVQRIEENPFLLPNLDQPWEASAAFNPCVVKDGDTYHLLYRAQSSPIDQNGVHASVSSLGYATSKDGVHFTDRRQFIKPELPWELYGCEDPRITKLGDKYYIFYTALSHYPFEAQGIKIGLAITKDFKTIESKHLVTHFNSKAMALFPEKINGKFAAILTVDTDIPPAKIALAYFDKEEDMWSEAYWKVWRSSLQKHIIPLLRSSNDHLEVGAPPVKTDAGWILIYSYIKNYLSEHKTFGIEALLLDSKDPSQTIARTDQPLIIPEMEYELKGDVPNVIFPSGALLENKDLKIYYGGADTTCCAASINVKQLTDQLLESNQKKPVFFCSECTKQAFKRYDQNPIISPRPEFDWEAKATFNPAAIYKDGKVHIIYRAMSMDDTSVLGYASSKDGIHIDYKSPTPIYTPRALFEQKLRPGNSGIEDPRITELDGRFYIFYTAFDGYTPRVAFTSISVDDFLNHQWTWADPKVITPPGIDDKDACLLPKKIDGKYIIFHRIDNYIRVNSVDSLEFSENSWLKDMGTLIKPRKEYWDNKKFGIASTPIETPHGWLLFFHRVTQPKSVYKVEALLLDLNDPTKVIEETDAILLEPETDYEINGIVNNVVFPCGSVIINNEVYLYYGGADKVVAVAKMNFDDLIKRFGK